MSESPYCPICTRVVQAVAERFPFLMTEGKATGFCQHTEAERKAAEATEDAAHAAAVKAKQTPQPKRSGEPL